MRQWYACGIVRSPRGIAAVVAATFPRRLSRHRVLSEGDCGCFDSLQTMPQHLRALLSSSAQVSVVSVLETACDLPAQTCYRQLCRRDGRAFCPSIFSLQKRNRKKEMR